MKNLQQLIFGLIFLIGFHINAFGQQFGITVRGGISRIYGQLEYYNYPSPMTTTSFSPSFLGGIYYQLQTGKKTTLTAELIYLKVQGGQTTTWDFSNAEFKNFGSRITYEHISFISLPVYYGVTYEKLTVNGGFQVSYALSSSGSTDVNYTTIITTVDNTIDNNIGKGGYYHKSNNLPIKNVDFGPRVGGIYQLTPKLSIEGMFYYGLNNINKLPSSKEALKIQQMTVGIRYALWSKSKTQ